MSGEVHFQGVQLLEMTEEAQKDKQSHLQHTLSSTGSALANLRFRAKNLDGFYAFTCVDVGRSYQPDSFLGLNI